MNRPIVHLQIPRIVADWRVMTTLTAPAPICSLGRPLDTRPAAFGHLRDANGLLDQPEALRARLDDDGYLYVRDFFDLDLIRAGRRAIFEQVAREGLLDSDHDLMDGVIRADATEAAAKLTFRPDLAAGNPAIRRVVFGPEIMDFYTRLFGEPVLHFDFIWCRLMGCGHGTPTHCDWVYMGRGSQQLLTCWVPYVDIPLDVGGLILLENSHHQAERIRAYLRKDVDGYCENRPAEVKAVAEDGKWSFPGWLSKYPDSLPEKFHTRWLTVPEWRAGDFITFRMDMIHGSLDNTTNRLRLSTDTRYQPASHPADERWIGANPPGHSLAGKRGRIC